MWRKFTVYGLRFSKTSFWNRINTGFLDPAVATALPLAVLKLVKLMKIICLSFGCNSPTACGIETLISHFLIFKQSVASCNSPTACGIETYNVSKHLTADAL